jgi:hypothetical protein
MANFRFHIPITAWEKSDDSNPMRIGGIVSTGSLDRQQERVVQDGLNFSPFLQHGWFNDNHGQKTTDVLGYPTSAKRVAKGERLPNGRVSEHDGWWAEGYLVNTDEGRKVYALARSLNKSPSGRGLGFSIEGKVGKRDKRDNTKITSADVHNVAITHVPVNTDTSLAVLAKALIAGDSIDAPPVAPGEGFPLRVESLDSTLANTTYGSADDEEDDEEYAAPWGPNGGLSKGPTPTGLTTIDYIEYLTEALGDWEPSEPQAVSVSKAEASVIVASRFPHWTETQVTRFILKNCMEDHTS